VPGKPISVVAAVFAALVEIAHVFVQVGLVRVPAPATKDVDCDTALGSKSAISREAGLRQRRGGRKTLFE
jgi:hypothetical protein